MPRKKIPPGKILAATAVDLATTRADLKVLNETDEHDAQLARELVEIENRLTKELNAKLTNITPGQLPVALAVVMDKRRSLQGKPSKLTAQAHVHIDGKELDRSSLLKLNSELSPKPKPVTPDSQ